MARKASVLMKQLITLKYTIRHPTPTDLVGVLHDDVFPRGLFAAGVDDGVQHPPGVAHVQCHLLRQLCRLHLLHPQHLVALVVAGLQPGDIAGGGGGVSKVKGKPE